MRDLTNARLIWFKAGLFVVLGGLAAGLLCLRTPSATTAILIALTVWAFARAYYFAFYGIERYVNPAFRFSGLISVVRSLQLQRPAPAAGSAHSGEPVFAGTRVPVRALLDFIEGDHSLDDFLDHFPSVTREQAIAFIQAAGRAALAQLG